jgi:hypothetical protein
MHNNHYKAKVQPIDLIEAFDLNFNRANVIKYTSRAGKKEGEPEIKDLEKALYYLQREINRIRPIEPTNL